MYCFGYHRLHLLCIIMKMAHEDRQCNTCVIHPYNIVTFIWDIYILSVYVIRDVLHNLIATINVP